jgi:hypothetical protein
MLPDYDPSPDVESLKKATKGFGTDNSALIRIMTSKASLTPFYSRVVLLIFFQSATQMAVLTAAFLARNGKSLEKVIKSETSGYYESVLVALCKGPLDYDAFLLREVCSLISIFDSYLQVVSGLQRGGNKGDRSRKSFSPSCKVHADRTSD